MGRRPDSGMIGRGDGIVRGVKDADDLVAVELTEMERTMLFIGLFDWGGPAYCGDSVAQALGFRDVQNLYDEGYPLAEAIRRGDPQSRRNWTRALASLEVMFGSSVLGSGEWGGAHGYDEDELWVALKGLRRKLPASRGYLRR
jgi:hypothetical protein